MVQTTTTNTTTGTSTTSTSSCPYLRPKAEQGWECPRCGRINAPWVRQCDCSGSNWTITCDDQIYRPEGWKDLCIDKDKVVGGSDYWNPVNKTWTNVPDSTYYNQDPSTKTIHNEKSNYKE